GGNVNVGSGWPGISVGPSSPGAAVNTPVGVIWTCAVSVATAPGVPVTTASVSWTAANAGSTVGTSSCSNWTISDASPVRVTTPEYTQAVPEGVSGNSIWYQSKRWPITGYCRPG